MLTSSSNKETVFLSALTYADSIKDDWTPLKKIRREEEQILNYLKQMEKREERKEAEQQAKGEQQYEEARRREEEARERGI